MIINEDAVKVKVFKDSASFCQTPEDIDKVITNFQRKFNDNEISLDEMLDKGNDYDLLIAGMAVLIKNNYNIYDKDVLKALSINVIDYSITTDTNVINNISDIELLNTFIINLDENTDLQLINNETIDNIVDNSIVIDDEYIIPSNENKLIRKVNYGK